MKQGKCILLTGVSGFIGRSLYKKLSEAGYEVWGISRKKSVNNRIVQGDLLSFDSTMHAISLIPDCPIIIHGAALNISGEKGQGRDYISINKTITENIVRATKRNQPYFIFLSSVAVYGEDGRTAPVSVFDELRPSTEYGMSKVICEEIIKRSSLANYQILRLCPVFDDCCQKNIKSRIYLPGQSKLKLVIMPSPHYGLCHVNTLARTILSLLAGETKGQAVINVVDSYPYCQNQLSKRFDGIGIPCPVIFLTPLYYSLFLLPPQRSYKLRCLFWKLFKSNLYNFI
ncbi:MAG: NAD(P)-dependent oxidoreductase [bacterium]